MEWSQIAERIDGDVVILDVQGRMMPSTDQGRLIHTIQQLLEAGRSKIVLNLAALLHSLPKNNSIESSRGSESDSNR